MNREGERVLSAIKEHAVHGGVAIDAGAHFGLWTRMLAVKHDVVYAFEPNLVTARTLRANLRGLNNVRVHELALGWVQDHKVAVAERLSGKTDTARISSTGSPAKTISLDSMNMRNVKFMKMDLEGFDFHALHGAVQTLLSNRPLVLLEQKDGLSEHYGIPTGAAQDFLRSLGMVVVRQFQIDLLMGW